MILAIVAVIIIIVVAFGAVIFLDLAAYQQLDQKLYLRQELLLEKH